MHFLLVVSVLLMLTFPINADPIESLEDVLVYPMEPATKKHKRDTEESTGKQTKFVQFVEEKLVQHSQALEHLLTATSENAELIKTLIENFGRTVEQPKLPEKLEVRQQTRRSNSEDSDNPLVRFGKAFPTYGTLFKNMLLRALERDDAPTPLVEKHSNGKQSRRSMGPIVVASKSEGPSPWCTVAVVCHRTFNPVCGYDDNFGYGKFDDLCHMLQVNCYWKYNFALVPTCRPVLKK